MRRTGNPGADTPVRPSRNPACPHTAPGRRLSLRASSRTPHPVPPAIARGRLGTAPPAAGAGGTRRCRWCCSAHSGRNRWEFHVAIVRAASDTAGSGAVFRSHGTSCRFSPVATLPRSVRTRAAARPRNTSQRPLVRRAVVPQPRERDVHLALGPCSPLRGLLHLAKERQCRLPIATTGTQKRGAGAPGPPVGRRFDQAPCPCTLGAHAWPDALAAARARPHSRYRRASHTPAPARRDRARGRSCAFAPRHLRHRQRPSPRQVSMSVAPAEHERQHAALVTNAPHSSSTTSFSTLSGPSCGGFRSR